MADASQDLNERQARGLVIRSRALELTGLVERRLPTTHVVTGDADSWPLIADGLLSRATTTLHNIVHLQDRGQALDAATLSRSLYDHVVHLAYLAADPSEERLGGWRKADLKNRLKADNDARSLGEQMLEDGTRAQMEVESEDAPTLVLSNLAVAADKHWAGRLPGMGASLDAKSFRGLYVWLFRYYSGTAHGSFIGLNQVVEDISPTEHRVVMEKEYEGRGPYGMATVIYAMGLFVASEALGYPQRTDIEDVFDRHPG